MMNRRAFVSWFAILFLILAAGSPVTTVRAQATGAPVLQIVKTVADASLAPGDTLSYTITVTNTGAAPATQLRVADSLPFSGGWTEDSPVCQVRFGQFLACEQASLAAGASFTVTVSAPVTTAQCGAPLNNTGDAWAANHVKVRDAADAVTVDCGGTEAGLQLVKTAASGEVNAGDPISFTLTVTNTGTSTAENVVVTDALDPDLGWTANATACVIDTTTNVMTCDFGDLEAGGSASVTVSAQTTPTSCGVLRNTATATADNLSTEITAEAEITIACAPALTFSKTAEADPITAGQTLRFFLSATNTGTGVVEGVSLTDVLPVAPGLTWTVESVVHGTCEIAGGTLTCDLLDILPGETHTVTISSPTTSATCGTITNTASVTSETAEDDPADNSDTVSVIVNCGTLAIDKAASADTVQAGNAVGFTITLSNTGTGPLQNVSLSDTLPAGFAWAENSAACSIANGVLSCAYPTLEAEAEVSVVLTAPTTASQCGTITNTASATATGLASPVTDTAAIEVTCLPRITLDKQAERATVGAGEPLAFRLVVTNAGVGAAQNVTLTDVLPTGPDLVWAFSDVTAGGSCAINGGALNCTFGSLAGGATASVRLTATSNRAVCGIMSNTATAAASNDEAPAIDIAAIDILCHPNVAVTKVAEASDIGAGTTARFTITVVSNGDSTAQNVALTDTLPTVGGLAWNIDSVTGGGSCAIASGALNCTFGSLAPGQTRSVVISAPTTSAGFCGNNAERLIRNIATVSASNEPEDALADDVASAEIRVNCLDLDCLPTPIYFNNFDTVNPGPAGWSAFQLATSPNKSATFLGEFANGDVRLSLRDDSLSGHNLLRVNFDMYTLRSWDGNTSGPGGVLGPDRWRFSLVDDNNLLLRRPVDATFSNIDYERFSQSYPDNFPFGLYPSFTGSYAVKSLGYQFAGPRDASYRFSFLVPHTERNIHLSFSALGMQPTFDESWGIDNVYVEVYNCTDLFEQYYYFYPFIGLNNPMLMPVNRPPQP